MFLEEFGEVGDLVGYCVCAACVAGRCFVVFLYGVSARTFNEDGLDAGGCVGVVVRVLASDGLDDGTEFASIVLAGCKFNVGQ